MTTSIAHIAAAGSGIEGNQRLLSIVLFLASSRSRSASRLGQPADQDRRRLLRGRPLVLRLPERPGDRRRLHVGRVLPRHRRRSSPLRLRRLPLLDRLPGRLAGRAAAGRRTAAQLRPVHDGRRARLPDAPAPGPDRGGGLHDHRVRSSTCWPRWSARARWSRCCSASRRSGAARASTIVLVGALMIMYVIIGGMKGTTWVQIVKAVLLIGGALLMTLLVAVKFDFNLSALLGEAAAETAARRRVPRTRPEVRHDRHLQDRPALARHRAGARHRRPAAHPDPLLHRADRQGRPQVGDLGDRHHRRLLPDDPRPRLRRGGAGRRQGDHARTRPATRPRRSWPRSSAAGRAPPAARSCWRSSRRSPSPPSSRWSPG